MRTTFNRTLAVAIAAGITVTGAQAVAPTTGNNSLIGPAVAEAQNLSPDGRLLPPTIDDYVYYETTIEGKSSFTKDNPRIYTLRQAQAAAKTQSIIQGYLLNGSDDVIYHGDIEIYTVNADTNKRVEGAPSNHVTIKSSDGSLTPPYQNDLQRNDRIGIGMSIYPVPGTWGAAIKVNNYSTERHVNMKTESVTPSYYRVVDLGLGYAGKNIAPGKSATLKLLNSGSDAVPNGTTFELGNDFNNYEGWNVSINRNTGNITVKLDENAPVGTNLLIPVVVNYPNGTPETITALASSSYSSDPGVKEVRNNNGVYTIVRTDGSEVNVKIDTTGDVTNVTVDANGDLVITYDNGKTKTVKLKSSTTTVTETGRGTPNHQITIVDSSGTKVTFNAYDNYVTKINPVGEGKFELVMRNGDKIQGSINLPESNGVVGGEVNDKGDLILIFEDGTKSKPIDLKHTDVVETGKNTPNHQITITTPEGKKVTFNAYDNYVTKINPVGEGKFELVMRNGDKIPGSINLPKSNGVVGGEVDKNGDLILVFEDGSKSKPIDLKHTDVVETGKNTANHQITITTPEGKKVTFNAYDNHVKSVEDNGKGVYTLILKDGTRVKSTIDTSNNIVGVEPQDNGDIVLVRRDGTKTEPIAIGHTTITHKDEGTPWHTVTITTPGGETATLNAFDIYISKITQNAQGDYEFYRTDKGDEKPFYTLSLKDLRDRIAALEDNDSPTREEFEQLQNLVKNLNILLDDHLDLINKNSDNIGKLRQDLGDVNKRVNKLTLRVDDLERYSIKYVRDNKDGSYTLIRGDNSEVESTIDGTGNVRNIIANPDGSITLVYANGETSDNIPLAQTTITEKNKGKPNHTITITSPNGDTVTFNAFDVYVTDVKKNDKGDYDIYRSDIGDGKKVWKTIVLSDLRDDLKQLNNRVAKLEKDSARHEKEIADLKKQITRLDGEIERIDGELSDLRDRMDDAEKRLTKIEGDIVDIKGDIANLDTRVTDLEKRVASLETSRDSWAKCYSSISMLAMPLALAAPLYALSQAHLPGVEAMNTQVQQQLGIYNEQLARMWSQHGDILGAASAIAGIAATIGAIAHISNECREYNETKAVENTQVGKLSSKRYTRQNARAAKRESATTAATPAQ